MRHETVWVDRTIDSNSIKINSEGGKRSIAAALMIEKNCINLTFFLLVDLLTPITAFRFSIEHSKEYYYRTLVIANIDNNVALTR